MNNQEYLDKQVRFYTDQIRAAEDKIEELDSKNDNKGWIILLLSFGIVVCVFVIIKLALLIP